MTPSRRYLLLAVRIAVMLAINAIALWLLDGLLPGFELEHPWLAIPMAAVIGILGVVVRPALIYVALPLVVLTGGLLALAISGVTVWIAAALVGGVHVGNWFDGVLVTLGLVAVNLALTSVLNVNADGSFSRRALRRVGMRRADNDSSEPGVVFLEIDGLSAPVLERAIEAGMVPTMARWLSEGSHQLVEWECDLSSQTGASQAGLLHGNNHDMPAFRWYEKSTARTMVSNHPDNAAEIEARISDGHGLLANGGVALGNMFSGDARSPLFTMSKIKELPKTSRQYYPFFADPYNYSRTLILAGADIVREKRAARSQLRRDERPRVERDGIYPLLRAITTVVLRDLANELLIAKMNEGVPTAYVTYVAYDEVAHHSGVERPDTLDTLSRLDATFAVIEKAAARAPREYHLVVLSDHGQSQGATFRQRNGVTLDELIAGRAERETASAEAADEGWGHLSAFVSDATEDRALAGAALKQAVAERAEPGEEGVDDDHGPIVMPSGNLALVYFPEMPERLSAEQIEERYPGLVDGLAAHRHVGFVMTHSAERGPVAVGADGSHELRSGDVVGLDPLADFGLNAARHLLRTDGFSNAPDLLVNSFYDRQTGEVAAFEELVGSHGGLGGDQSRPLLLYPAGLSLDRDDLVGAEAVHRQLKAWVPTAKQK
jgi:uncharacterized membrane protein YvlD (DUF360 family)